VNGAAVHALQCTAPTGSPRSLGRGFPNSSYQHLFCTADRLINPDDAADERLLEYVSNTRPIRHGPVGDERNGPTGPAPCLGQRFVVRFESETAGPPAGPLRVSDPVQRVSAARLLAICEALDVSLASMFERKLNRRRRMQSEEIGVSCYPCLERETSEGERQIEMRVLIATLIVLATVYFWDREYNYGRLFDGLDSMVRSISRSMLH
jgi:hypothetical protein